MGTNAIGDFCVDGEGKEMGDRLIVSSHRPAILFIKSFPYWKNAPVIGEADPDQIKGRHVAGDLPLRISALASSISVIEFGGEPPRSSRYDVQEMVCARPRLRRYVVRATIPIDDILKAN